MATVHRLTAWTLALLLVAVPVAAQKKKGKEGKKKNTETEAKADSSVDGARQVANEAIAELAGWQIKAARRILEKNEADYGDTAEYQAARALLEAQEAARDDGTIPDDALSALDRVAKNQRTAEPAALYFRGELLYQQQKNDQAADAWKAAADRASEVVEADPDDAAAQFYLGAALVRQRQLDKAMHALKRADELGFDTAMVQHQIGFIHLFEQDWKAAKEAFDAGLDSDPRYAPMYYWRAMAWDKLGRKDNMLIDLDQYVKLAPNGPEAGKAKAVLKSVGK